MYFFVRTGFVCQCLKLLKLGCELKCISPQDKILSIPYRYFNYDIENKWAQKQYTRVCITLF